MELTIQYVHAYQELAKNKLVPSIESLLGDASEYPEPMLPELDENDNVVFYALTGNMKVTPGLNVSETIITSVDSHRDFFQNLSN